MHVQRPTPPFAFLSHAPNGALHSESFSHSIAENILVRSKQKICSSKNLLITCVFSNIKKHAEGHISDKKKEIFQNKFFEIF